MGMPDSTITWSRHVMCAAPTRKRGRQTSKSERSIDLTASRSCTSVTISPSWRRRSASTGFQEFVSIDSQHSSTFNGSAMTRTPTTGGAGQTSQTTMRMARVSAGTIVESIPRRERESAGVTRG